VKQAEEGIGGCDGYLEMQRGTEEEFQQWQQQQGWVEVGGSWRQLEDVHAPEAEETGTDV
jgi:hypothetical protein